MRLLPKSSVARKFIMAVTGQVMVLFVLFHLIVNSTVYFHRLSAYAEHLHDLYFLLWMIRIVILAAVSLHIITGISLYLENRSAKPVAYAVKRSLSTTFASTNMIWSGALTGAFIIFHLLHFTIQVITPEFSANKNIDGMGRPDVQGMVLMSFHDISFSLLYICAVGALVLHLLHGIQSSFQSLGLSNEVALPVIIKTGVITAIILFAGYSAIPVAVYLGILKG